MDKIITVGNYLHDLFFSRFSSHPIYLSLSLIIILLSSIGAAEVLLYISYKRILGFYLNKRDVNVKESIITMLANVLVFNDQEDPKEIAKHFLPRFTKIPLYRKSVRKILVTELLNTHVAFSGRSAEVMREIYIQLKLDRRAKKNLKCRDCYKKIEAIRELADMAVKSGDEEILQFTDHDNPELRFEAQAAFIRLCGENPFRFLDTLKNPILPWHQITLFEVVTKAETMARPQFSNWLNSKNESVVLFCLKMIEYYQQFGAVPHLIYLLDHYDEEVRGAAIDVLGKLEAEISETHFLSVYPNQPQKIKTRILNALGNIASGNSLTFLDNQARSKEFPVRMAALKAIKAHRFDGQSILNDLFIDAIPQEKTMIKHVLDERIKAS